MHRPIRCDKIIAVTISWAKYIHSPANYCGVTLTVVMSEPPVNTEFIRPIKPRLME